MKGLLTAAAALFAAVTLAHPVLEGVQRIAAPGIPGPVVPVGENAEAIVVSPLERNLEYPVVSASRFGEGRVVGVGHGGYLSRNSLDIADTCPMFVNLLRWASEEDDPVVGVVRRGDFANGLTHYGMPAQVVAADVDLATLNVLIGDINDFNTKQFKDLRAFVEGGGTLLVTHLGWGWLQLNPGKRIDQHPINQLCAPMGLVWSSSYGTSGESIPAKAGEPSHSAFLGLQMLGGGEEVTNEEREQAVWALSEALPAVGSGHELVETVGKIAAETDVRSYPTPQSPVSRADGLARVIAGYELAKTVQDPLNAGARPAAQAFPGAVPEEAERIRGSVTLDSGQHGWISTGLYAAPGETVSVVVPPELVDNAHIRLGAHSDQVYHKERWERAPEISFRFPVDQEVMEVANPFGGLIYVEIGPAHADSGHEVLFGNVVAAPHFVLDQTTQEQWEQVRAHPAPWAELQTRNVILTVPASAVRELPYPEDLMLYWDEVLDACADLAAVPRDRGRPERFVTDQQISAGYMHAGYPIMTHLDIVPVMLSKDAMLNRTHGGVWGLYHEAGHNHQNYDWTFNGTVEVTVNLFTMYVFDTVNNDPRYGRDEIWGDNRARMIREHMEAGAPFDKWQSDPFLALLMYLQMQQEFGWDAYKQVFAEYLALPQNERPQNDAEKRDQWLVRFSREVGRNLGPFFDLWGVPVSAEAKSMVEELPVWIPEEMETYVAGAR
ncbi:MAG: M60 family metallopeptidase [Fimbriimonadaceae bacterium]